MEGREGVRAMLRSLLLNRLEVRVTAADDESVDVSGLRLSDARDVLRLYGAPSVEVVDLAREPDRGRMPWRERAWLVQEQQVSPDSGYRLGVVKPPESPVWSLGSD